MMSKKFLPVLDGSSWMIGATPDLSVLGADAEETSECVDHHVFQSPDGKWHLWACIRGTPVGRVFYHWEADSLTQENWKPTGEMIRADRGAGECLNDGTSEELMSPFVVSDEEQFYMFYSGADVGDTGSFDDLHLTGALGLCQICLKTSPDGRNWTRHQNDEGLSRLFCGPGSARDPSVMKIDGVWHMYYAGYHDVDRLNAGTYLRTSTNLVDWSDWKLVHYDEHFHHHCYMAECPTVVKRDDLYYLFITENYRKSRTYVFCSDDPEDFGVDDGSKGYDVNRYFVGTIRVAAPEIIVDPVSGQEYITTCDLSAGIRMHRLKWSLRE